MTKGYARFITVLFCLFLGGLMVWQAILPDRERSDVENRTLAQIPELTVSGVLDGTYMEALEEYVQDQFPLRDGWTGMKARAEQLLGKQLFNNVYLCGDTLISKVDAPEDDLDQKNLSYVGKLSENPSLSGPHPLGSGDLGGQAPGRCPELGSGLVFAAGGGPGGPYGGLCRCPDGACRGGDLLPHGSPLDFPGGLLRLHGPHGGPGPGG